MITLVAVVTLVFCSLSASFGVEGAAVKLYPGMKSGEPITDAQFFAALDLDLPGLQKVKSSVATQDWQAARSEFYLYLKEKFQRANYYTPSKITDTGALRTRDRHDDHMGYALTDAMIQLGKSIYHLDTAENNLLAISSDFAEKGVVHLLSSGGEYSFDASKPFDFIDFDPGKHDYFDIVQMYAMYDMAFMREGYFRTGNPVYVRRAEEMIESYRNWFGGGTTGPFAIPRDKAWSGPYDNWTVPRRMGNTLKFLTLLEKTDLDPDVVTDAMKSILEDERLHVSRANDWRGNWIQFMCTDGAATAAIFFEFKESKGWWDNQIGHVYTGSKSIYPDGSNSDFSTSYLEGFLQWMDRLSFAIESFGSPMKIDVPAEAAKRYEKAIDWEIALHKPNGIATQFSDTNSCQETYWYAMVAGKLFDYFGRDDLRWIDTEGKTGSRPTYASFPRTSVSPSYSGQYIMRSDWGRDALYLGATFGPAGTHAHPDYGSFILYAYGADLVDEGGCAVYGNETYNEYSRKPWAHNVMGVDGQTANNDSRPPQGKPLDNWITNTAYDMTWGRTDLGTNHPALTGVIHRRAIYFAKPDYYLLLDRIDGEGEHKLRSKIQLAMDVTPQVNGSAVEAVSAKGASLAIIPFDKRVAPSIVKGQKKPFWDGWTSTRVPHSRITDPAPAVVYETSSKLPVMQETLLYPSPKGHKPEVGIKRTPADEDAAGTLLEISPAGKHYRDEVAVNWSDRPVSFAGKGITIVGQLAHLRYDRHGKLKRIAFVKLTELSLPSGTIKFDAPTDGFMELGKSLQEAKVYTDLSNRGERVHLTIGETGKDAIEKEIKGG